MKKISPLHHIHHHHHPLYHRQHHHFPLQQHPQMTGLLSSMPATTQSIPYQPSTTKTQLSDNQSPCLTATPVTINRERSRTVLHDVSGVKIYEDMDEIGDLFEDSSYDSYEIVEVENNTVIGRATFGTLKSSGTLRSRIL